MFGAGYGDAEIKRLQKTINKTKEDLNKSIAKLNNQRFMDKTPVTVVTLEKQRQAELTAAIQQLDLMQR